MGELDLPDGYRWVSIPGHRALAVATPRGATIRLPYGATVGETATLRVEAAHSDLAWCQTMDVPRVAGCPDGVDPDVWWHFVTLADCSIYGHCMSGVDTSGVDELGDPASDWMDFERARLIRGALAVYTDKARRGLAVVSGCLSGEHADRWRRFGEQVDG